MAGTMRRWEMNGIGRDRLELRTVTVPSPGPGEVLVRVQAVALNHRDKMVVEEGRGLPLAFPFTPGSDLAGTVASVGDGVSHFAPGDGVISVFTPEWIDGTRPGTARKPAYRTLGGFFPGVLADHVAMPEDWLVHAPESLAPWEACTLPCAGLTAWFALVERAGVRPGEVVLILGTGGVGLFGLQIAKAAGATVIVSSSSGKMERVLALGADHFVDRHRKDWLEAVYATTGGRGADHVLDMVGGSHFGRSVQAAAVGGTVCQIGALDGFELSGPAMPLMLKDVTVRGIATGSRAALERLVRAADRLPLRPVVEGRYGLAELPRALDHLGRGPFGKIIVDVAT